MIFIVPQNPVVSPWTVSWRAQILVATMHMVFRYVPVRLKPVVPASISMMTTKITILINTLVITIVLINLATHNLIHHSRPVRVEVLGVPDDPALWRVAYLHSSAYSGVCDDVRHIGRVHGHGVGDGYVVDRLNLDSLGVVGEGVHLQIDRRVRYQEQD